MIFSYQWTCNLDSRMCSGPQVHFSVVPCWGPFSICCSASPQSSPLLVRLSSARHLQEEHGPLGQGLHLWDPLPLWQGGAVHAQKAKCESTLFLKIYILAAFSSTNPPQNPTRRASLLSEWVFAFSELAVKLEKLKCPIGRK